MGICKIGVGVALMLLLLACAAEQNEQRLPYLGIPKLISRLENGVQQTDTIFPVIPSFALMDQDSVWITNESLRGQIYIADFIFLSCPTICPRMTSSMKEVYQQFSTNPKVKFLSHTIDPKRDSIPALKSHVRNLRVDGKKWHFVTGEESEMMTLAEEGYYSIAMKDAKSPGGYAHSGGLLLIDTKGHIRGVYDGTKQSETDRLKQDVLLLLKEK
jgi:protein SCO1